MVSDTSGPPATAVPGTSVVSDTLPVGRDWGSAQQGSEVVELERGVQQMALDPVDAERP